MIPQPTAELRKRRILVAEDHPLVREFVTRLIDRQPDLISCGTAERVCDLSPAVRAANPDLLLLDLGLKDGNALPHIHPLREAFPSLRILVLSQCDENQYAETALRGGAHGYIMKERATDEVLDAIRSVLRGEIHLSPQLAVRLANQFSGIRPPTSIPALDHLSARELQVLQLIGAGLGTRDVADQLGLGIKTVETYREKLKVKLNLTDAAELVRYAKGLLEDKSLPQTPTSTNASLASPPAPKGAVPSIDCHELAPDT